MAFDLKKIKSLFIIEEEETAPEKKAPKKGTVTPGPEDPSKVMVEESREGNKGQVKDQFTRILFSALEKNNLSGMDYLEFKQSLRSLEKMPMEEKVRYQSAFAMAQTMGATPQKLIESADHYLNVLKGEESKFEKTVAHQKATRIASRQEKIGDLEKSIRAKADQIKQLTQEIEKERIQVEALQKEIKEASNRVETTKNDFIASYNALVAQILRDVENMKKFLK